MNGLRTSLCLTKSHKNLEFRAPSWLECTTNWPTFGEHSSKGGVAGCYFSRCLLPVNATLDLAFGNSRLISNRRLGLGTSALGQRVKGGKSTPEFNTLLWKLLTSHYTDCFTLSPWLKQTIWIWSAAAGAAEQGKGKAEQHFDRTKSRLGTTKPCTVQRCRRIKKNWFFFQSDEQKTTPPPAQLTVPA